jgi:hypothetical protein
MFSENNKKSVDTLGVEYDGLFHDSDHRHPSNSHEASGTSYVSQQHNIFYVNLYTNRNTDTMSHY